MTTQQTAAGVDARRAITGWLVRTVLFMPFIGAMRLRVANFPKVGNPSEGRQKTEEGA